MLRFQEIDQNTVKAFNETHVLGFFIMLEDDWVFQHCLEPGYGFTVYETQGIAAKHEELANGL